MLAPTAANPKSMNMAELKKANFCLRRKMKKPQATSAARASGAMAKRPCHSNGGRMLLARTDWRPVTTHEVTTSQRAICAIQA